MKKISILFLSLCIAGMGFAKQYCDAALQSRDGHNATITMQKINDGMYEFSITTENNIASFNAGSNFFAEINGVGGNLTLNFLAKV